MVNSPPLLSSPMKMRVSVVLPAPFFPTNATFCCRGKMKSSSLKTWRSSNDLLRSLASMLTFPERGAGGKRKRISALSAASTSMRSSFSSFLINDWAKAALFFFARNLLMSTSVSSMYFC